MEGVHVPNCKEFRSGLKEFDKIIKRDPFYRTATFLISEFWGRWDKVADGLIVLLATWNQAFYRYGSPDWDKLERWLRKHERILRNLRRRNIDSFSVKDKKVVNRLFNELVDVLGIRVKRRFSRSPVAAAKTLHLLAPNFFPLWDGRIAKAYGCNWYISKNAAEKYILFCEVNKEIKKELGDCISDLSVSYDVSALKLIDQYNYAKYTQKWI